MFRQDFTCPALLEDLNAFYPYGAITRYGPTFQTVPVLTMRPLAWSAFARHY
jgi:chorismate mutase